MSDEDFTDADCDPPPHLMGPENPAEYDAWLRAKVEAALANPSPAIPPEEVVRKMQAIIDTRKGQS